MPSEQPSAAAPAPLSSPRWTKPSSGPHPRVGDGNQGPNPSPLGPPWRRSELKRRLRASAEIAAAAAARGSDPSVAVEGGHQRLGPAGVTADVGQGAIQGLWSDADEVTLLAAAAAFRERTGRAPSHQDAGALFDSIRNSISPHIDEATAYDKLRRFESKFLHGALGSSAGTHDRRVHDLSTKVWGVVDVLPPPEDDSDGQEADESSSDERGLITERTPKLAPAPMPSERSSASAVDADSPPSPSSSKKRSSSPQSRMGDGHQDPNSSPRGSPFRSCELNRKLRTPAESVLELATAAAAAARGSDVDGGHDAVQSLEPAAVPVDVGHGAVQSLEPADDGGHGAARNYPKTWSDADEVTLLAAAAAFRERTGRVPRDRDAGVLFRSIRASISPHINEAKTSYKLSRFRSMFRYEAPGESATTHNRRVHDLSSKVWGVADVVARDAAAMMPVVTGVLDEYWKRNERAMAGLPLEKGLSLLGEEEGRFIETKWRQQVDEEMQTHMQRHDLAKEICGLLNDTIKGFEI